MKLHKILRNSSGVTLVELLVVMVILGLVVVGIYNTQQGVQRSTYGQEDLVDVQQNVRVGLDSITRDLLYAGFLVPKKDSPLSAAAANTFTLQVMSTGGGIARVTTAFLSPSLIATTQSISLDVSSPFSLNADAKQNYVRIIRPGTSEMAVDRILTIVSNSGNTVTVSGFDKAQDVLVGDILVRYIDPNTDNNMDPNSPPATVGDPGTITYSLVGGDLMRNTGSGNIPVASNITALTFSYTLDNGAVATLPVSAADLSSIRSVTITITGQKTGSSGTKTRSLQSTVSLRNR